MLSALAAQSRQGYRKMQTLLRHMKHTTQLIFTIHFTFYSKTAKICCSYHVLDLQVFNFKVNSPSFSDHAHLSGYFTPVHAYFQCPLTFSIRKHAYSNILKI